jgi:hypothetical protein
MAFVPIPLIAMMVALIVWCVCGALWPREMWQRCYAWHYRDPLANEPSDASYRIQRFVSGMLAISLTVFFVFISQLPGPLSPEEREAEVKRLTERATFFAPPIKFPNKPAM